MNNLKFVVLSLIIFLSFNESKGSVEKLRCYIPNDPATTMGIAWNQKSGINPQIYFGTEDFGDDFNAYPNVISIFQNVIYKGMDNHFMDLTNLIPDQNYYFVIVDSEGVSDRYWFRTFPATASRRLSVIAGGDTRTNRFMRIKGNALVGKLKPDLIVFTGDLTFDNTDDELDKWFDDWQFTISDDGKIVPMIMARGNHEIDNDILVNLFNVPNVNNYYFTGFCNNLFQLTTLNSEVAPGGNQVTFLEEAMIEAQNYTWNLVQYHRPIRPHCVWKEERNDQYNAWANLFYDYKVQLVLEGDAHLNKITWPIRPSSNSADPDYDEGFVRDNDAGTVYAGEGSWGAPKYFPDDKKKWTRNAENISQFKWLWIDQNEIEIRTIRLDNAFDVECIDDSYSFIPPKNLDVVPYQNKWSFSIEKADSDKPSVSIVKPASNESITIGQTVEVEVESTGDNAIEKIEFFVDGVLEGELTSGPFVFNYSGQDVANVKLHAQVTDLAGNVELSNPILLRVGEGVKQLISNVSLGSDDAEEDSSGSVQLFSSDIEMTFDGGSQIVAFRFEPLGIPNSTLIQSAYIQFTANEAGYGPSDLQIFGEKSVNPQTFKDSIFNISGRVKTNTSIDWSPAAWEFEDIEGIAQRTPELKSILQELVNKSGYDSQSSTVFIIQGSGERVATSIEGDRDAPARLIVEVSSQVSVDKPIPPGVPISFSLDDAEEYENGEVDVASFDLELVYDDEDTGNQILGLRFPGLEIPSNAIIIESYIQFQVDDRGDVPTIIDVYGEYDSDAKPYFELMNNISSRTLTSELVTWEIPEWENLYERGPNQRTPDLSAIIDEMLGHPSWSVDSPLAFVIMGTGEREAVSYNGNIERGPRLFVNWTIGTTSENFDKDVGFVFPNPTKHFVYVKNIDLISAELFDIAGNYVRNYKNWDSGLSVEGLPFGVYLLKMKTRKGSEVIEKIIVQ